jgi:hypothetical protein
MSTTEHHDDVHGRKAVLVCRVCDREAGVDGDWAVTEYELGDERHRAYQCPDCWHTLVVQPVFADELAVPA